MAQEIPRDLFARLSELIRKKIGLHFPEDRWGDLERGVRAAALELGFEDTESCIRGLMGHVVTKVQLDTLVAHLTVGETYFLRDESHFQALQHHILPGLMQAHMEGGPPPRFWSAACCTGEEPYTIAMMLEKMGPFYSNGDFSVLATDINTRFLEKARKGVYTNWSLRNAPSWMVEKYFKVQGKNRFEIDPRLKKGLRFTNLNLVDPVYPSPVTKTQNINVIFCRNVLMYFNDELRSTVIDRLSWALADGGWLFVGPSEAAFVDNPNLQQVSLPGAMAFQKTSGAKAFQFTGAPEKQTAYAHESPDRPIEAREDREKIIPEPKPEPPPLPPAMPVMTASLHEEALGLVEKGDYEAAIGLLENMLGDRDPGSGSAADSRAMALLARTYANLGKLEPAREWGLRLVEADKLNPGHRYLLATIFEELNDLKKAAELLQASLFLDSRFVLAHFALGNNAARQGRTPESKRHFKNALGLLLAMDSDAVIPHSGGMTAGRLTEIVRSMILGD